MEISPEVQALIDSAVEEATTALVAKNQQLLSEKKKLQKTAEIDPQMVTDLEAQVEKLQADLATTSKEVKDKTKALEQASKLLQSESSFTHKLLIDNGLTDELVKAGVSKHYLNAAKSLFASKAQIVADGDSRVAKIGDKALADAISEWVGSEEGKHFISAPANSGGGSQGGGGTSSNAKTISREGFDALSPVEKTAFAKSGGQIL